MANQGSAPRSTLALATSMRCGIFIALGMHLLIFEDIISELRAAAGALAKAATKCGRWR